MTPSRSRASAIWARLVASARWLWWKPLALGVVLVAAASAPWWGPRALRPLAYFHVRRIEVVGARFLAPSDVVDRLRVDTASSVWDDLRRLERRVAAHPQVQSVMVERKLPATIVVRIIENLPVALMPGRDGLTPVDATGRILPIDPSRVGVDLPVVPRADTSILRLLGDVRALAPAIFDRISDARRSGRDELVLRLATLRVLVRPDIAIGRLADIVPVEQDVAKKNKRLAELDLRFRDQVIARVQ
ncbi:MAG: FtsQ-type POTRA domain-containing protein [Gemmatimonadaceae bacterium]